MAKKQNKNLIKLEFKEVYEFRSVPKKYDRFPDDFPYCSEPYKKTFEWWINTTKIDYEKRAIYLTKWYFVYQEMFKEYNKETIDYDLNNDLLGFLMSSLDAYERNWMMSLVSHFIKNNYKQDNAKEANEKLLPKLGLYFKSKLIPQKGRIDFLEVLQIFSEWIKILPFPNNKEAREHAKKAGVKLTIGESEYNRFLGHGIRLHTSDELIKLLKNWGSTMLKYYSNKLKETNPDLAYKELRIKTHEANQNKIYDTLEGIKKGEDLELWNQSVKGWLSNEKAFYMELKEDFQAKELFDKQVNQLTEFWIKSRLGNRLSTAPEKALLIADEIDQIKKILSGETKDWTLQISDSSKVVGLGWYVESNNNDISDYYREFIIKNNPFYEFVTPKWEEEKQQGHNAVLAVALYEYKKQLEKIADNIPDYLINNNTKKISYNWEKLTEDLIENSFVDKDTKPETLQTFFENQDVTIKIKWIDKAINGMYNKHTLFTLILTLIPSLIETEERSILYQKIIEGFTDGDNKTYSNGSLRTSLSGWNKRIIKDGLSIKEKQLEALIIASKL